MAKNRLNNKESALVNQLMEENRKLKKQMRDLERRLKVRPTAEKEKESKMNSCPKCSNGQLQDYDWGVKTGVLCTNCDYRKVTTKKKTKDEF